MHIKTGNTIRNAAEFRAQNYKKKHEFVPYSNFFQLHLQNNYGERENEKKKRKPQDILIGGNTWIQYI